MLNSVVSPNSNAPSLTKLPSLLFFVVHLESPQLLLLPRIRLLMILNQLALPNLRLATADEAAFLRSPPRLPRRRLPPVRLRTCLARLVLPTTTTMMRPP